MAYDPPDFDIATVRRILIASEAHKTSWRDQSPGHSYERHVAITNDALRQRMSRTGKLALRTAFVSPAQQVEAARDTLNSAVGKYARAQFFYGRSDRTNAAPKPGMKAEIFFTDNQDRMVRYANGAGMIPLSDYVMVLLRDDEMPERLFVLTFFPTIFMDAPNPRVKISASDGRLYAQGP
jgi:hypothetical protein